MKFSFLLFSFIFLFGSLCFSQDYDYYTPDNEKDTIENTPLIKSDTLSIDSLMLIKPLALDSIVTDSIPRDSTIVPIYATVTMNNQDVLKGELIKLDSTQIVLKTTYSELILDRSKILAFQTSFSKAEKNLEPEEKVLFDTPQANYFLGPTARPVDNKKIVYQNVLLLGNKIEYGLTPHLSFDLALDLTSITSNAPRMSTSVKAGFKISKNIHAAGVVRIALDSENRNTEAYGLGYGVITLGTSETNITLGSGYGLLNGEFFDKAFFISSGVLRFNANFSLITENYYAFLGDNEAYYFGAHGLRAILNKDNCFDIGFMYVEYINDSSPIPMVGYSKKF